MKNSILLIVALFATLFCTQMTAQNSKKVWVEAGKGAFFQIPKDLRGTASAETITETKDFSFEKGSGKLISRINPDGKVVSIKIVPDQRMQVNLKYEGNSELYINDCCQMCYRLGYGLMCCLLCKIEHGY